MSSFADVPVACTKSGLVLILEAVLPEKDYELAIEKMHRLGGKVTFTGRGCAGCYPHGSTFQNAADRTIQTASCEYRPLKGPLFVPR